MTQPSLFERTTTGLPISLGLNTRSHETKKLLQSKRPTKGAEGLSRFVDDISDDAPNLTVFVDGEFFKAGMSRH